LEKALEHDNIPYDPAKMATVVNTYNIMENEKYKNIIDAIQANDNVNNKTSTQY